MSRVPVCPNPLSIRPRIIFHDRHPGKASLSEVVTSPTDKKKPQAASFAATTAHEDVKGYTSMGAPSFESNRPNREQPLKSQNQGSKKHEQLSLRRKKYLESLNLSYNANKPFDVPIESISQKDFAINQPVLGLKRASQGHTADLCRYMKLQFAHGVDIPVEFAACSIHHMPVTPDTPMSSEPTLQGSMPTSGSSDVGWMCTTASTGSSTLISSSETPSPARQSSEPPSPDEDEDEDPFLYIAKHSSSHPKSKTYPKPKNNPSPTFSTTTTLKTSTAQCPCSNHKCLTYLSGAPSQHCRSCRLGGPQPEISAAMTRIANLKKGSLIENPRRTLDTKTDARANQERNTRRKDALHDDDVKLVEMYNAEMEKRCERGV